MTSRSRAHPAFANIDRIAEWGQNGSALQAFSALRQIREVVERAVAE